MSEPFTLEAGELVQKGSIGPDDLIVFHMAEAFTKKREHQVAQFLADLTHLYRCEAIILSADEKFEVYRKEPVDHLQ